MSCCGDYELPEFYMDVTRKAIKKHTCYSCGATISRGEHYERVTGKWDGDVLTFKTCQRCLDLRNFVDDRVQCCWSFQNMREDILNAAREYSDEAPGLLFGAYRREILIRRSMMENYDGRK